MQTFTTLNAIREHSPCANGWSKLLAFLGKTKADDAPVAMVTILESNGIEDAIWCLRALNGKDKEIRLFAVECVEQVKHLLTDKRSLDALEVANRYAHGEATIDELRAAADAAYAVVYADAADAAAYAAAYAAADATYAVVYAVRADAAAYAAADAAYAVAYAVRAAYAAAGAKQEEIFLKYFGQ